MCASLTFQLENFLSPFLSGLDAYLDKRLVKSFVRCIAAILIFRKRGQGLNITELGSYIEGGVSAAVGTKRLHRLLESEKWEKSLVDQYLWEMAEIQQARGNNGEERPFCVWDGSVLEKPESEKTPGLCRVKSSKAKRLRKRRKGIFNQPGSASSKFTFAALRPKGIELVSKRTKSGCRSAHRQSNPTSGCRTCTRPQGRVPVN